MHALVGWRREYRFKRGGVSDEIDVADRDTLPTLNSVSMYMLVVASCWLERRFGIGFFDWVRCKWLRRVPAMERVTEVMTRAAGTKRLIAIRRL